MACRGLSEGPAPPSLCYRWKSAVKSIDRLLAPLKGSRGSFSSCARAKGAQRPMSVQWWARQPSSAAVDALGPRSEGGRRVRGRSLGAGRTSLCAGGPSRQVAPSREPALAAASAWPLWAAVAALRVLPPFGSAASGSSCPRWRRSSTAGRPLAAGGGDGPLSRPEWERRAGGRRGRRVEAGSRPLCLGGGGRARGARGGSPDALRAPRAAAAAP